MSDEKKLTREELAAALEAKAKALRENQVSDEEVERLSSAGCNDECCGGCTMASKTCKYNGYDHKCGQSCFKSSPS